MTTDVKRTFGPMHGLLHDDYASAIAAPVSGERSVDAIRAAGGWLARQASATGHAIVRAYRRWKTIQELQALDDRMLKDIGIDRSEIERVVKMQQSHRVHRPLL
ncbi:MAG: DUF1127 domain-containing protein [Alphaproteobacteria bacterium]|nr:DUF1127 domain-containing protein [Alphaproteobacteria bacterium]